MIVMIVHVHVKPEFVNSFKEIAIENASNSIHEPGITRFDVVQSQEDPTRFILYEAYRNAEAQASHKQTRHYQQWNDAVAGMMVEPRSRENFTNVYPAEEDW